jgi:hypothetical protein
METAAVILVAAIAATVWFWMRSAPGRDAEARLRRICHGNQEQAERLIAGEIARAPGLSRVEAAARAVARYERDNR